MGFSLPLDVAARAGWPAFRALSWTRWSRQALDYVPARRHHFLPNEASRVRCGSPRSAPAPGGPRVTPHRRSGGRWDGGGEVVPLVVQRHVRAVLADVVAPLRVVDAREDSALHRGLAEVNVRVDVAHVHVAH